MKSRCAVLVVCLLAAALFGGCGWMGRTAGKVQAKMERKADALEDGYNQGYNTEKGKTAPKSSTNSTR